MVFDRYNVSRPSVKVLFRKHYVLWLVGRTRIRKVGEFYQPYEV